MEVAQKAHRNRASDMVQLVKCLFCKHENLDLIPRNHVKKMKCVCRGWHLNPSPGEVETGGPSLAGLVNSRPMPGEQQWRLASGLDVYPCTHVCTYTFMHTSLKRFRSSLFYSYVVLKYFQKKKFKTIDSH